MHACSAFILSGCLTQVLLYMCIANNMDPHGVCFQSKSIMECFGIYTAEVIRLANKIYYWQDKGYMGPVATKPVFGVSNKATLKPLSLLSNRD